MKWEDLSAPDLNQTLWDGWEQNPEPYGGEFTLQKIKSAGLNSAYSLDLSYHKISDLTPLTQLSQVRELYLQSNNLSDIAPYPNSQTSKFLT